MVKEPSYIQLQMNVRMGGTNNYLIMKTFPDFNEPGFDINAYNRRFIQSNVVINAISKNASYDEHWGPLSTKSTIRGNEYYHVNNNKYAVTANNYLIINDGNYYSTVIDSETDVESFTINFSASFMKEALALFHEKDESLLQNFDNSSSTYKLEFIEQLYLHDDIVSPIIQELYRLSQETIFDNQKIEEFYFILIDRLLIKRKRVLGEINKVNKVKESTKLELYKRLNKAKDYIDSFFMEDITLKDLSQICLLNQAYLLRQFKNYFNQTPRQYIIKKRMEKARLILEVDSSIPISEACLQVGYNDPSSFSKLFKHFFRLSPEKFQQKISNTIPTNSLR